MIDRGFQSWEGNTPVFCQGDQSGAYIRELAPRRARVSVSGCDGSHWLFNGGSACGSLGMVVQVQRCQLLALQ